MRTLGVLGVNGVADCLQTVDLAAQHGVDIGTFRPHSTHLSQPLDVGCMFKLKDEYSLRVSRWKLEAPKKGIPDVIGTRVALEILAQQDIMKLTAWDVGFSANTTRSAFAKAGFCVVGNFVQVERAAAKKYFGEDGLQMIGAQLCLIPSNECLHDVNALAAGTKSSSRHEITEAYVAEGSVKCRQSGQGQERTDRAGEPRRSVARARGRCCAPGRRHADRASGPRRAEHAHSDRAPPHATPGDRGSAAHVRGTAGSEAPSTGGQTSGGCRYCAAQATTHGRGSREGCRRSRGRGARTRAHALPNASGLRACAVSRDESRPEPLRLCKKRAPTRLEAGSLKHRQYRRQLSGQIVASAPLLECAHCASETSARVRMPQCCRAAQDRVAEAAARSRQQEASRERGRRSCVGDLSSRACSPLWPALHHD